MPGCAAGFSSLIPPPAERQGNQPLQGQLGVSKLRLICILFLSLLLAPLFCLRRLFILPTYYSLQGSQLLHSSDDATNEVKDASQPRVTHTKSHDLNWFLQPVRGGGWIHFAQEGERAG